MSDDRLTSGFVGEIRMFAGDFAPLGWLKCDGQLVPISEFEELFNLIGVQYGGDGVSTFQVPDLRGRAPMHRSGDYPLGNSGGVETVTLTPDQLAKHDHVFNATTALANQPTPAGNTTAQSGEIQLYTQSDATAPFNAAAVLQYPGGGQPHENMVPFGVLTYIICISGVFPTPS